MSDSHEHFDILGFRPMVHFKPPPRVDALSTLTWQIIPNLPDQEISISYSVMKKEVLTEVIK